MNTPRTTSSAIINEPPMLVLPSLAARIGLNEAIMIQQVHFWLLRTDHEYDGRKWIYNSLPDWTRQMIFWSENTVARIIANLETRGLLLSTDKYNRVGFDKTKWYTIDYDALEALMINTPPPEPKLRPKRTSRKNLTPSHQVGVTITPEWGDDDTNLGVPIPETTTENNNIDNTHTRAHAPAVTETLPTRNPAITITSPARTQQRPPTINRAQQLTPVKATVVDSFDNIPAAGASIHSDQERAAVVKLFIRTYPRRYGVQTDTDHAIYQAFMRVPRDAYAAVIQGADNYARSAGVVQRNIVMGAVRWLLDDQWTLWQQPEQSKPTTGGTTRGHYESKGERAARNLRLLAEECAPEAEDDQGADHQEPSRLLA